MAKFSKLVGSACVVLVVGDVVVGNIVGVSESGQLRGNNNLVRRVLEVEKEEDLPVVPDAEFLGYGYHILKADPFANGPDPAFAGNIWELKYDNGHTASTSNGDFKKPDFVTLSGTPSCTTAATVKSVENTKQYQDSLSVSVSVEGSAPTGGSASLSTGYKEAQSGSEAKGTKTVVQNGFCEMFKLSLEKALKWQVNLSDNFKAGLEALPLFYDKSDPKNIKSFGKFFDQFGTHMTSTMTLGGRVSRKTKFAHTAMSMMESSEFNIEAAASASYAGFTAGVEAQTDKQKERASTFDSESEESVTSFTGGDAFRQGEWVEWEKSVKKSPAPVKYDLIPLEDVVLKLGNPTLAEALKAASADLCEQMDGCVSKPDNTKSKSILGGFYQVDECDHENVYNVLAGWRLECPMDFRPHSVGRHMTQLGCRADLYMCVRIDRVLGEVEDGFGGAYGAQDHEGGCAGDDRVNPLTGSMSCPAGTHKYLAGRVSSTCSHGYSYYLCLADLNHQEHKLKRAMGGFYEVSDSKKQNRINNPRTRSITCSRGYDEMQWFRGQWEGATGDGNRGFLCV